MITWILLFAFVAYIAMVIFGLALARAAGKPMPKPPKRGEQ